MLNTQPLLLLLAAVPAALGDVLFSVPATGGSYPASTPIILTWVESNVAPAISALSTFELALNAGTNEGFTPLKILSTGTPFPPTNTISVTIDPTLGGNITNAYFFSMKSILTAGGFVINYSGRFSMTGMTGTFTPPFIIPSVASPPRVAPVPGSSSTTAPAPAQGTGAMTIPFPQQIGPSFYAPMQPIPGTQITATNTAPLYATSAVVIATTFLPPQVTIVTTIAPPQAAQTVSSHQNKAAAATQPVGDMAKFLARWKD